METITHCHGHWVLRVWTGERAWIVKWTPPPGRTYEPDAYRLLQDLGVPTIQVHSSTSSALLLEDLAQSRRWRLASAADVDDPRAGEAVAEWYLAFHKAGEASLSRRDPPAFLRRESDELDPLSVRETARLLGMSDAPVWLMAADSIERLKAGLAALGLTFNYNDFDWTNLALTREAEPRSGRACPGLHAVVFDYHLLGLGTRFSDCRNAAGSLAGPAVAAFWDAYGEVDPRERILDRPLSTLFALQKAARMPVFPRWAREGLEEARGGGLLQALREAVGSIG